MRPVYPTKTFPAHYSIVTGLYPDNHGLIENNMFDTERGLSFGLANRKAVQDPVWWGGEPVWNTAQKQGQIAAAYFWPGTETAIGGMQPKFWKDYDGKVPNDTRVDTVLGWLDLPVVERPTMITMYFRTLMTRATTTARNRPRPRAATSRRWPYKKTRRWACGSRYT